MQWKVDACRKQPKRKILIFIASINPSNYDEKNFLLR